MGFLSGGAGDDRLQVGMAVMMTVMSLVVTMMVPIVAPAYDVDTGYGYADLYAEKASLEAYTGESMVNMAPWKLTGVYTPWTVGDPIENIDPETGWAYGAKINNYPDLNKTNGIKLDPDKKSNTPLYQATYTDQAITIEEPIFWYYNFNGDGNLNLIGQIAQYFGADTINTYTDYIDVNSWTFTGYRYEFDPMLKIDYASGTHDYSSDSQTDAKLSVVWYKTALDQGISGGLVLYNNMTNGIVANIPLEDILLKYNQSSNYSTRYTFDFEGVQVYLNLRFDLDVLTGGEDLTKAFDDGRWTIAITAASMDNYMDISSSNSLSSSTANIIDTYIKIYTFSFPTLDFLWSMVLWIVCILPIQITVLMFLSRFGIAGVGLGIVGSALLAGLGMS